MFTAEIKAWGASIVGSSLKRVMVCFDCMCIYLFAPFSYISYISLNFSNKYWTGQVCDSIAICTLLKDVHTESSFILAGACSIV